MLCSPHGAAGDGDDRQGNRGWRGDVSAPFHVKVAEHLYGDSAARAAIAQAKTDAARCIQISWHLDDMKNVRPNLTGAQAAEVLRLCKAEHDASIGINWDTIRLCADRCFPKPN